MENKNIKLISDLVVLLCLKEARETLAIYCEMSSCEECVLHSGMCLLGEINHILNINTDKIGD